MSDRSKIEWTDATWNPIRTRRVISGATGASKIGWHCEHVSEGCANCYAEGINKRLGTGLPFKPGHRKDIVEVFLDEKALLAPLRWKKPRMVSVCSMTDLFADFVPDDWIDKIFAVMALCPQHTFQVLTKRAERMCAYVTPGSGFRVSNQINRLMAIMEYSGTRLTPWPLPNVWLGISAERQQEADERIPHLLQTPAAVRFVSLEPLLGPISFRWAKWQPWNAQPGGMSNHLDGARRLDWVIVGGESGPKARPMNPQWARDLRDQCQEAGVPYFFKQHGEFKPVSDIPIGGLHDANGRQIGFIYKFGIDGPAVMRVGKKAAGRLLDRREHNDMPRCPSASTSQTLSR